MDSTAQFKTQKAYRRMLLGGLLGGVIVFACGYWFAWYSDNLNPVTGLGLLLLSSTGVVAGTLISLFSKKWNHTPKT